jgi:cyclopropane fatty-acyl-phospholipid synthase-like methyltransferase
MFFLFLVLFLIFFTFAWAGKSLAPWVPCRKKDIKRVLSIAELKPGEVFYELGCGDGRVVVAANKNYQVRAIGVELAVLLYIAAKIRQCFNWNKNLEIRYGSLFKEDLASADVVYVFGMPQTLKAKFKEKLEKELKPGARVVSYVFPIEGWKPIKIDKPTEKDLNVYLYFKS